MKEREENFVDEKEVLEWDNALPILIYLTKYDGEISIDRLRFLLNENKEEILKRVRFLHKNGLVKYDENRVFIENYKRNQ